MRMRDEKGTLHSWYSCLSGAGAEAEIIFSHDLPDEGANRASRTPHQLGTTPPCACTAYPPPKRKPELAWFVNDCTRRDGVRGFPLIWETLLWHIHQTCLHPKR